MSYSLAMLTELIDGVWVIEASWLDEPVTGVTWFEAYWLAVSLRH